MKLFDRPMPLDAIAWTGGNRADVLAFAAKYGCEKGHDKPSDADRFTRKRHGLWVSTHPSGGSSSMLVIGDWLVADGYGRLRRLDGHIFHALYTTEPSPEAGAIVGGGA